MLVLKSKGQYFVKNDDGSQGWTFDELEATYFYDDAINDLIELIENYKDMKIEILNLANKIVYANYDFTPKGGDINEKI